MSEPISPNVPDVKPDFVEIKAKAKDAHTAAAPPPPPLPDEAQPALHRENECIPNVPDVKPAVLGEKEAARAQPPAGTVALDEVESSGWQLPNWLRWGYLALGLAVLALFGVFVFSQAISALALAASLPEWQRYLLLVPLALCGLLLLFVLASLAYSWFRLRTIRQIDLSALTELKNRAATRRDGVEHLQAARQALEKYLQEYPLLGRGGEKLGKVGFDDELLDKLVKNRDYLLGKESDSQAWLGDFSFLFQKEIDAKAMSRINSWALRAAGCVIASPLPLLDAILILSISLRMIKELCVMYNVRTGSAASFLLFTRAIRNAFIAGLADEAGQAAGEAIGEEMSGMLGEGALGTVSASFARVAMPKLGEGALNGLFMRRLGKATMRLLQPVRAR